jgi:hypothetical protein
VDWQPVVAALAILVTAIAGVVVALTPVVVARLAGKVDAVKTVVDKTAQQQQAKIDAQNVELAVMRARLAGRRAEDSSPPGKDGAA